MRPGPSHPAGNMQLISTIDELKARKGRVVERVADTGWAVVRGLFDREGLRAGLPRLYAAVGAAPRLPSASLRPEVIRGNVVKWSIGSDSSSQAGLPRMMLIAYNPLWAEDVFGLRATFSRLIEVRDALAGRETLTDERLAPDRWNACRVQIYPAGGGFMGSHVDSRARRNLPPGERVYVQLVLLLTERGLDYAEGGAFVHAGGCAHDIEHETQTGDVLVYDGASQHGVADIDPGEVFQEQHLRGRAVAVATVYDTQ